MAQQAGSNPQRAKPKPSSTTQPRGPEVAGSPPQILNPSTSGPKSSNPHGKSGQESIHPAPQDVSRPIQRRLTEKSGFPWTIYAPKLQPRYRRVKNDARERLKRLKTF